MLKARGRGRAATPPPNIKSVSPPPPNICIKNIIVVLLFKSYWFSLRYNKCAVLYTLVICSINLNKYDIKCLSNLMILSIYKEEVYNIDMKSIVNNYTKNGDGKLENFPRWGESKADIWVQMPI